MSPFMLRQVWSVVETAQTNVLLNLDDESLVQWLVRQLKIQQAWDTQDADLFSDYIHSRLPLIRDLARSRRVLV